MLQCLRISDYMLLCSILHIELLEHNLAIIAVIGLIEISMFMV